MKANVLFLSALALLNLNIYSYSLPAEAYQIEWDGGKLSPWHFDRPNMRWGWHNMTIVNNSANKIVGYVRSGYDEWHFERANFSLNPGESCMLTAFGSGGVPTVPPYPMAAFLNIYITSKNRVYKYDFDRMSQRNFEVEVKDNNGELRLRFKNGDRWETQDWTEIKRA